MLIPDFDQRAQFYIQGNYICHLANKLPNFRPKSHLEENWQLIPFIFWTSETVFQGKRRPDLTRQTVYLTYLLIFRSISELESGHGFAVFTLRVNTTGYKLFAIEADDMKHPGVDSKKGNLIEYCTEVHCSSICSLLKYYLFWKHIFTAVHLKEKYCSLPLTPLHFYEGSSYSFLWSITLTSAD